MTWNAKESASHPTFAIYCRKVIQRRQQELSNALIKSENAFHFSFQKYVDIFHENLKMQIFMKIRTSRKYIEWIKVCN